MNLGVNFNAAAVRTHQNLVVNDRALNQVFDRLSTGMRLRSAADDPASMVLANTLRYQLKGLAQATQNAEEGVNMLQTVDGSLDEVSALLNRMRSIAVNAANESIHDPGSLSALQAELNEAIASVTRIATNTKFGSISLLDGTVGGNQLSTEAQDLFSSVAFDASLLPGGVKAGSTISVLMPPAGLTMTRDTVSVSLSTAGGTMTPVGGPDSGTLIANLFQDVGGPFEAQLGTVPATVNLASSKGTAGITVTAGTTIADFVSQVNASTGTTGIRADYAAGQLRLESVGFGATNLAITSTTMDGTSIGLLDSDTSGAANAFATAGTTNQLSISYTDIGNVSRTVVLDQKSTGDGLSFSNLAGGPEGAAPFTGYEVGAFTVTVKDTTAGAAGSTITVPYSTDYYATRSSTVRIQTGAKANQSISVDVPDTRASALGWTAGLAAHGMGTLQSLSNGTALLVGKAQDALKVIDAAITEVGITRGRLGAVQNNAIEATLSSLRVTSENLIANESRLRDTDFALESAKFAQQNVLYQAATAMLAQANQVPQTVLQLLRPN